MICFRPNTERVGRFSKTAAERAALASLGTSDWMPSPQLAAIERDSMHQLMHPYDFSSYKTRKSLGINVVDGAHYYKPRPKSQIFRIPYYSSYVWH